MDGLQILKPILFSLLGCIYSKSLSVSEFFAEYLQISKKNTTFVRFLNIYDKLGKYPYEKDFIDN